MVKPSTTTLRLRVIVVDPPAGVTFAVQRGKADLLAPTFERDDSLQFDLDLRFGGTQADGSPNWLGEFAQGTPADRFVYVNSGTLAGQPGSCWTRRAKLKLGAMPTEIVEAALAKPGHVVEARIVGTLPDGSPVCASIKPHAVTWTLARDGA